MSLVISSLSMKPIVPVITCLIAIFLCGTIRVHAKRSAPKPVAPVFYKKLKITAPLSREAFVVAHDAKTGEFRWKKQIYKVRYFPFLEKDIQEIYITRLQIEGDSLIITDEKKRRFQLNLDTLKVIRLK